MYTFKKERVNMKKGLIKDIATSFTALTFLVIAISGVMMFFHFNKIMVKELHEILGLVFVVAAFLHLIVNWKSMKNYFSKKSFVTISLIVIVISGIFVVQSNEKGENPKAVTIQKILEAPIIDSFKILNGSYENAIKKLEDKNIKSLDSKNINAIAKANQTSPFRIISIITIK
jgi:uncharacterized membrane protein YhaH (DUF805 family)